MTKTLLIVEDEPELARLLRDVLVEGGFQAVLSTGTAARATMQQVRPAAIVMDYVMPGYTGADVVADIRAHADVAVPPIILVTGREDASALADQMGADAYLRKPFDVDDLLSLAVRLTEGD